MRIASLGALTLALPSTALAQDSLTASCDSVRAQVAADSTLAVEKPKVFWISTPPQHWPKDARGHAITYTLEVDTTGHADLNSLVVEGTTDARFIKELGVGLAKTKYGIAHMNGCTVPWHHTITLSRSP